MGCGLSWDFATLSGRYTLGIIFIIVCAIIWAGASVLIQYIYEDLDFRSPFFLTYMATSLLAFHLPAYSLHHYVRGKIERYQSIESDSAAIGYTSVSSTADSEHESGGGGGGGGGAVNSNSRGTEGLLGNDNNNKNDNEPNVSSCLSRCCSMIPEEHHEVVKIAMIICPLWFGANCLYNYSLLMTSVSSSTIISNLSASFTLAFSWFLGIEEASPVKIVGILICFAGAVSVGLQDDASSDDDTGSVGGDVMAVAGSLGYGLYTTAMRYKVPDDNQVSMQLLLGYIGLINSIVLAPALVLMFMMRWGNVQDISGKVVGFITLNGFADTVLADYFWARAVILTSPTVATIGMSVTIPIAILTDYILHGVAATWISVFGALLVVAGFVLVNMGQETIDNYYAAIKEYLFPSPSSSSSFGQDKHKTYEQISPITERNT